MKPRGGWRTLFSRPGPRNFAQAAANSRISRVPSPNGRSNRFRRAAINPEDVGVVSYGARRVPGLRREELAQLVPNAEFHPDWKEEPAKSAALQRIRAFLREHTPAR